MLVTGLVTGSPPILDQPYHVRPIHERQGYIMKLVLSWTMGTPSPRKRYEGGHYEAPLETYFSFYVRAKFTLKVTQEGRVDSRKPGVNQHDQQ